MTPLKTQFRQHGFDFNLLKRHGQIALLKKTSDQGIDSFEVVVIQQRKQTTMFNRVVDAHEAMPPSESWGTYGWSYNDEDRANRKYRELSEK
jgi:hypothetical protein